MAVAADGGRCRWRSLPMAVAADGGRCRWRSLPMAVAADGDFDKILKFVSITLADSRIYCYAVFIFETSKG